jgi:hypothetical protein
MKKQPGAAPPSGISRFVSVSISFMDPLFLIIIDIFCTYAFLAGLYGSV